MYVCMSVCLYLTLNCHALNLFCILYFYLHFIPFDAYFPRFLISLCYISQKKRGDLIAIKTSSTTFRQADERTDS